jgi:transposase InsO family protein
LPRPAKPLASSTSAPGLTHRTKGKAERFIQTLCKEWAYAMAFQNSKERDNWLPRYLSIYHRLRKHLALGDRSPQQRLNELLC